MNEDDQQGLMARWGALGVLSLTMFIVVLDTSMMNVAVPQITRDLDVSVGGKPDEITEKARYDAVNASLLVLGAFVLLALIAAVFPPMGKLVDRRHPPDPDA